MKQTAEAMHLRTGDPVWRALARRWSKVFAILFAVGAASGTIISTTPILTLLVVALAGPAVFLANELGGLVSELGRQPWVVYGVFRTSRAITTASGLGATFAGFTILYFALSAVPVLGVRRVSTGTPYHLLEPVRVGA